MPGPTQASNPEFSNLASAKSAQARNLAKISADKFGPSAGRSEREAMADRWLATVGRKFQMREGEAVELDPSSLDGLPEWAAKAGLVGIARILLPVSDPKANGSEPLRVAVEAANLALVELLAPLSDVSAKNCAALRKAVDVGELEIMQVLIPLTPAERAREIIVKAGFEDEGERILLAMVVEDEAPSAPKGMGM